jgi:CheY-like chemotaxis protein
MAIKQALIVDDSKSARLVLKRMLKELTFNVDTVESAIDALGYLENHQPDVIFMDHMMPGMDGFEAIKHIKTNPNTAVIPIMMYTSRGGDVYLSQARALGAVGIIPKTISPVGLKESLFKLGLIDDRRVESTLVVDEAVTTKADKQEINEHFVTQYSDHDTFIDELQRLMDDQTVELHKSMWLGVESVSHEIYNRLNGEREKQLEQDQLASQAKNINFWPLYIVSALLMLSIIFNFRLLSDNAHLEKNLIATNVKQTFIAEERSAEENLPARSVALEEKLPDNKAASMEFFNWANNMFLEYPFDELALNDKRLPHIEALVNKALEAEYSGNIILQTHVGRFCMSRDATGDYKLADDNLPITQCEYIGNNFQPNDEPSAHQSLSFANLLSEINSLIEKSVVVEVANVPRTLEISKYPEVTPQTRAEEWNFAAKRNNRITVKLEPAPTEPELKIQ